MEKEIWKDVEGFPKYEVSNRGRVRNKETGQILKPGLGGVGYLTVALWKDKKSTTKNVHQLVANAFVGKQTEGMTVNHKDGIKTNNNASNLEIISRRSNNIHAYETGLNPHKKSVRIVETGEVFDSQKDCAKAIDGDTANISACLSGKLQSHKGLHFERVDKVKKKEHKPFLYDYQMDAIKRLRNGCILCGSVGSGKSRTGLFYYFKENGGWIDENGYTPMKNPQDLYIITTAKKRDSMEFERELAAFLMSTNPENNKLYNNKIVVDSWNNIKKYADVKGAFFLLDEQRLVGSGTWVRSFYKIAKNNDWILLTATPGDTYVDYIPMFVANGFFKNKTEFNREHVEFSRFTKYPKIEKFHKTDRLDRLRDRILIRMNYQRKINVEHDDIYCKYDVAKYKDAIRNRWDPFNNKPIEQASSLCYVLRRIVNSDQDRQMKLLECLEDIPRAIIFYNFDFEREILLNLGYGEGVEVAEWSGHAHQPIPDSQKWVYLCQYNSACEGWECIKTNVIIFFSQNYSYKTMTQAAGRIDRLNTPFDTLRYIYLKSRSGIDLAISKALNEKKKFNETRYAKKWVA